MKKTICKEHEFRAPTVEEMNRWSARQLAWHTAHDPELVT